MPWSGRVATLPPTEALARMHASPVAFSLLGIA
jgi:hypothetical protein